MTAPHESATGAGNGPYGASIEWLGWDGRELRWRLHAPRGTQTRLCLDGVAFQPFTQSASDDQESCVFDYSPTGNVELEFSIASAATMRAIGTPWRVRFGVAAGAVAAQWTQAPRYLAPLAGTPQLPLRAWPDLAPVAIVVPIHNAPQSVQRCLAALVRWTPRSARLILIDDASTDPQIAALLEPFARRDNVIVERNATNRGYTHSVNAGMQLAGDADVVLLNSDTEVGPRWLQALRLAAYTEATIGTITAVSDNAGAFSVPELEHYCPVPVRWDLPAAQRAVLQQAGLRFPELPTGNGFCMLVKRELIGRIGLMDADAFPSGYGEENDFCQRAVLAGYRNVIAGHVLVRHERSASFGDARRAALGIRGMEVLRSRYPGYEAAVGATLYSFTRRVLDYRVRRTYADSDGRYADQAPRPRVLIVAAGAAERLAAVAALGPAVETFDIRPDHGLLLQRHAGDGRFITEATGAPGTEATAQIRAWLLAWSIEYVFAAGAGELVECLLAAAGTLDVPVLQTPADLPPGRANIALVPGVP